MEFCLENNVSMIRLLQEDVFSNVYDWQTELLLYIKLYDQPSIKMLDQNDQYEVFEEYYQYDPDFN